MPRLARPRTGVFDDLADQLRFAPRAALLLQITRAERLASEIDADENYPEDWLVSRITGFRPDIDDPALIVGRAILADLSVFVELLCDRAGLTRDDLPDQSGVLTIEDLAERWGVDRRTIDRYRRRGLVARRVRTESRGGVHLLFLPASVRAFEARSGDALASSAAYSRLTDRERSAIERRAGRYRKRLGWTRAQAAARLATRMSRSPATIDRVLRAYDGGGAPAREPIDAEGVFEAWRQGASVASLVRETGRSRGAVHHLIAAQRARLLKTIEFVPGAADDRALQSAHARAGLATAPWDDARGLVDSARSAPPVARAVESGRALALVALRRRASSMIAELPDGRASSAALDRIETDLRWIARLVAAQVRAEAALILRTVEERACAPFLELTPADAVRWFETAIGAACVAALRFDPSRGGRLAAPITIAMSHALAGLRIAPVDHGRARAVVRLPDWTLAATPWQRWLEPGDRARALMLRGGEVGDLLRARYGLDGGPPRTIEEIGAGFGVSGSALARIERS